MNQTRMRPRASQLLTQPSAMRAVMGQYVTGAVIITGASAGGPVGMAVNSMTSVSLEPPLILFCPAKTSSTWPQIRRSGHFAANVLGAEHGWLCTQFARKDTDRWAEAPYYTLKGGSPVLVAAAAYLDCELERVHEAGDHFIAIGRVLTLGVQEDAEPLVCHRGRFRELAPILTRDAAA